jgi:hypothetical protein
VCAGSYAPVVDFVLIAGKVRIDAEIANSGNEIGTHGKPPLAQAFLR